MDQFASVLDTIEGRHNKPVREMPPIDAQTALKALILDASKEPCFLCQAESWCVKVWQVPEGLNINGQAVVLYGLCEPCQMDVASPGKAELRLIQQMRKENGQDPITVTH